MPAINFTHKETAALVNSEPTNNPAPLEAIVRTHRMGICGTDISAFLGKFPFFEFPRIPGHELGVEVIAVGSQVDHLQVGDRCSLEPYLNNPNSPTSKRGLSNCCTDLQVFGVHCDGGLRSETYAVPANKLHVGNQLSFDQLALVEPLAIGYHAVQRSAPKQGEIVFLIGAGPIGLACLEFLKLHQTRVVVIDLDQQRLNFCQPTETVRFESLSQCLAELTSMTNGQLADLVIDATGNARSMSSCLELANFGGRIVYVGVTPDELSFAHAPVFHRRELTLLASRNALPPDFNNIIRLLSDGKINLNPWITHRLKISEVPTRFAQIIRPESGVIKAIIDVT